MQDLRAPVDRRRRPDGIIKFVNIASAIGWIMIIISCSVIIYAKPEDTNMFYQMFHIPVRNYWNYSLLSVVFYLLIFLFVLSVFGIIANATRQRRKTDRMKKSLIFQAIMSALGMIVLLVNSIIG